MSASLGEVITVEVAERAARATLTHLRDCGRRGVEGMVLWAGKVSDRTASVDEAIVPRQDGRVTDHGLIVTVSGDELHRINVVLYRTGRRLIGQVHSHPGRAYHSEVDDEHAIATEVGAFSIVVPDFAAGAYDLRDYAIYRLHEGRWPWDRRARWRALPPAEVSAIFLDGSH